MRTISPATSAATGWGAWQTRDARVRSMGYRIARGLSGRVGTQVHGGSAVPVGLVWVGSGDPGLRPGLRSRRPLRGLCLAGIAVMGLLPARPPGRVAPVSGVSLTWVKQMGEAPSDVFTHLE